VKGKGRRGGVREMACPSSMRSSLWWWLPRRLTGGASLRLSWDATQYLDFLRALCRWQVPAHYGTTMTPWRPLSETASSPPCPNSSSASRFLPL